MATDPLGDELAAIMSGLPPAFPEPSASELAEEQEAVREGRFTAKEVIKPDRDKDFYVGWSHIVEAPVWMGTRAEAIGDGCPPSRLDRADLRGTSIRDEFGCDWDDKGLIAEQRGFLPRARIAAYAVACDEGRMDDAWDLLEPFDDETPVRRG
jgi:hypothetical protein